MIKLKENRGILLVSTFVVAAVLSVLSGAYVTSSFVQHQAVQKQKAALQTFYAAERGIEYAYIESQNQNWNWATHEVANTDLDGDGQANDLVQKGTPPSLTLPGTSINNDPSSDCYGCYEITTLVGTVQLKTYIDSARWDETVVLSKNTSGSVSRILKYRITRSSLFKYFYFYPRDKTFESMVFDGRGKGGIYVNGNIGLGTNVFSNIAELSTNENGKIYLAYNQYTPPYLLDNKIGGVDGRAPLPSSTAPYIYSSTNPYNAYPWNNADWPPNSWPPKDWRNVGSHFNNGSSPGSVNGVVLPRTLSTSWQWNKYWETVIPPEEVPVQFYDDNNQLPSAAYWNNLEATYGAAAFDPAFWSDKIYKRTIPTGYTEPPVPVTYLDTDRQADDWNAWLNNAGINLKDVVKEKNSGGYDTVIPNIQANYSSIAKESGLYVGEDGQGNREVYLNGVNLGSSLPAWITDNVEFFNTARPTDRNGDGAVDKENVLQLDILAILPAEVPDNNVIYIASKNLRVVNASQLPEKLTLVSPYNIYLKGDFNNPVDPANWKASAVITNSMVYLLSNDFVDLQTLPATLYPRMYPYELQWLDLTKFTPGVTPAKMTNMQALEQEIKTFFALRPEFNINSPGKQPNDLTELVSRIRGEYNDNYESTLPNIANSTTLNVAIASPYEPSGYQLERWSGNAAPKIKGAFLQLESSWANDGSGNPIRDVPPDYIGRRPDYSGAIIPRPNNNGQDPATDANNLVIIGRNPNLEYEERFSSERPPADSFATAQPLWEETSDFNHHT